LFISTPFTYNSSDTGYGYLNLSYASGVTGDSVSGLLETGTNGLRNWYSFYSNLNNAIVSVSGGTALGSSGDLRGMMYFHV
jgi:hypothetical protein